MLLITFARLKGFSLGIFDCPATFGPLLVLHGYYPVASYLGLIPLAKHKSYFGNTFLKGLLSDNIDSPTLLSLVNFKFRQRSSRSTFRKLHLY